jgi:zinc protease
MWGKDVSRKIPIGDHDVILSATPEKMHAIQQKYYWPNNSLLIVAGDVDHTEIFGKVKNIFGSWESSGFDPFKKWPIPEFKPIEDDISFITTSENAQAPVIYFGWQGPDTRKDIKGTYVADVFSYIINLETSRFTKDLVDGGLALESNLSYGTDIYTGPIQLRIVPNPQKIKECLAMVEKHIAMWDSKSYFTDEQIQTAASKLAIESEYGREQTSSYVHSLGYSWAIESIFYNLNYPDNVRSVTREDLEKYARKYIVGKHKVSGLLVSPSIQQTLGIKKFDDLLN